MVEGTALYIRRYSQNRQGSPKQLAKRFADHGASWAAIGGPWHEERGGKVRTGVMNSPETCKRLADAFWDRDINPFIWGYPWQGTEEKFADQMSACAGEYNLGLLDPELGSNPTRSKRGAGKRQADAHARRVVKLMAERFDGGTVGLSTYGSGVRMGFFPLHAFAKALAEFFPGRTFLGGQTYTDDARVDPSIADFLKAIEKYGGLDTIQLVPNFGTYKFVARGGKRQAIAKSGSELYNHFGEFIDEGEPVHAMIGWAENFMNDELWKVFARMSDQLSRGVCQL